MWRLNMWRKRKPADFQAELDAHLQLEADELRAEGASAGEADSAARRALGNRTSAEERFYESNRWMFGQHLLRDLRFATRVLSKEPKFAILTILGLALGIGVSTAIFMFVSAATGQYNGSGFRQAEDVRNPASYISIDRTSQEFQTTFSFAAFQVLKDHAATLDQLAAESDAYGFVLASRGLESVNVTARFESENFLSVRGFRPALGRSFSNDEERTAAPVALLGYRFWQQHFSGNPAVLGQTILLKNHPVIVIGVTDPPFHPREAAAVYLPLTLQPLLIDQSNPLRDPSGNWLMLNARLRSGVSLPQAQAECAALMRSLEPSPSKQNDAQAVVFAGTATPRMLRQMWGIRLGADLGISMILLIACSNLASLLLARATVRRRELGVRLSLGASRARLVCQLLTESLLLSTFGGLLGILFSTWLAKWLLLSLANVAGFDFPVDNRVLFYGLILSLVTGFSFGLGPALAATKTNLAQALHSEGMAGPDNSSLHPGWSRRNLLVIIPLAASLMLLIGSAVSVRGANALRTIKTSFDQSRVIAVAFQLNDQGYDDATAAQFRRDLRDRFSTLPGVASAALTDSSPFVVGTCEIQNPSAPNVYSLCHRVSPQFFETLGLRILRGRPFLRSDRAGSAPVAVVSQAFAAKFWPGKEALGQRVQSKSGAFFDVIGVAADIASGDNIGPIPAIPSAYVLSDQDQRAPAFQIEGRFLTRMDILVRSRSATTPVIAELRQAVRAIDPSVWVSIQTLPEYFDRIVGPTGFAVFIMSALGGLVLLMASVGIYALLAYSVSQRTREIGIRITLGARNREILWLVMRRTISLIAWGIACGLAGALALGRILTSLILRTNPPDALTCIVVALTLGAVSLLASYLPARKALRVNPVEALRAE